MTINFTQWSTLLLYKHLRKLDRVRSCRIVQLQTLKIIWQHFPWFYCETVGKVTEKFEQMHGFRTGDGIGGVNRLLFLSTTLCKLLDINVQVQISLPLFLKCYRERKIPSNPICWTSMLHERKLLTVVVQAPLHPYE